MPEGRTFLGRLELSYELALSDSPLFRAALQRNEDEIEEFAKWLDMVIKSVRAYLEDAASNVADDGLPGLPDSSKTAVSLKTLVDLLSSAHDFQNRLIKNFGSRLLFPLLQSAQEEIREVREARRAQERALEKYETYVMRYNSVSKMKDGNALREDSFQLYEARKAYFQQTFDYVARINKLKLTLDNFLVEKILTTVYDMLEYYQSTLEVYQSLKPHMDELKKHLVDWNKSAKAEIASSDQSRKNIQEKARGMMNPDAPYMPSKGVEKHGYLFKKKQKGIGGLWKRVYLSISNGLFKQMALGKQRGVVETSLEFNVLLCEIRPADIHERSYCFETFTAQRSFIFQAESEDELRDWIRTFENAKSAALKSSRSEIAQISPPRTDQSTLAAPTSSSPTTAESSSAPSSANTVLPGAQVVRWNQELHGLTPSLPTDELVLCSFACALQKEIVLQGRLYATQARIYFNSNIFGFITSLTVSYSDIESIQIQSASFYTLVKIDASESHFTFKKFVDDDSRSLEILEALYKNSQLERPKSTQELVELLLNSSRTEEPPRAAEPPSLLDMIESGSDDEAPSSAVSPARQETQCGCPDHLERQEANVVFPVSVAALYEMLFGDDLAVIKTVHERRKIRDLKQPPWEANDGKAHRDFEYMMPLNSSFTKLKETRCFESWTVTRKEALACYVIDAIAKTPNVMYGNDFATNTRYCITRVTKNQCRLVVSLGFTWHKNPIVKSIIRSAAIRGFADFLRDYVEVTWEEIGRLKPSLKPPSKGRLVQAEVKPVEAEEVSLAKIGRDIVALGIQKPLNTGAMFFGLAVVLAVVIWICSYPRLKDFISINQLEHDLAASSNMTATIASWYPRDTAQLRSKEYRAAFSHLDQMHHEFNGIRVELRQILQHLNDLEHRIFEVQYVTYLTDQLTACYNTHPSNRGVECASLYAIWRGRLKK